MSNVQRIKYVSKDLEKALKETEQLIQLIEQNTDYLEAMKHMETIEAHIHKVHQKYLKHTLHCLTKVMCRDNLAGKLLKVNLFQLWNS